MAIRKLLVPLLEAAEDRRAILHSVEVARQLGAHVTVLFSGGQLSEYVSPEMSNRARVKSRSWVLAEALLREQTEEARQSFVDLVSERGLMDSEVPVGNASVTLLFEECLGTVEAAVDKAAVYHDAVVFYRDDDSPAIAVMGYTTLKSALQSSGRPIFVLPDKLPQPFASNVAIAWNGSIESAHAVSAALPLLSAAKSVHILTVGTQKTSVDQAEKLQHYLGWHGVQAAVHTPVPSGESVGATLLSAAQSAGADLLVLGAYTHNRIRQAILGGVTHHMVVRARIPLFLAR